MKSKAPFSHTHSRYLFFAAALALLTIPSSESISVFAGYREGIDTTESTGSGLDGLFRISKDTLIADCLLFFETPQRVSNGKWYPFNHQFHDITRVPSNFPADCVKKYTPDTFLDRCFIAQKNGGAYYKIRVIRRLSPDSDRYVFLYGFNDVADETIFTKDDYDRDSLYKPNNFRLNIQDYTRHRQFAGSFQWDPPLDNNNTLLGYEVYCVDTNRIMEKSVAVDLDQWRCIGFTNFTAMNKKGGDISIDQLYVYWNCVAVYLKAGDTVRSQPFQGWTCVPHFSTKMQSDSIQLSSYHSTDYTDDLRPLNNSGLFLKSTAVHLLNGRSIRNRTDAISSGILIIQPEGAEKNFFSKPLKIIKCN